LEIECPKCGGKLFTLIEERLSDRMLADRRLRIICNKCGYEEDLYHIG
jgi:ribosomal protein S27AE